MRISMEFRGMKTAFARIDNPKLVRGAFVKAGALVERQTKKHLSGPSHSKNARMKVPIVGARGKYTRLPYQDAAPDNPFPGWVTTRLMKSVTSKTNGTGYDTVNKTGPHTKYARIQELGGMTGRHGKTRIKPRPYLWPAFLKMRATIITIMRKARLGKAA